MNIKLLLKNYINITNSINNKKLILVLYHIIKINCMREKKLYFIKFYSKLKKN